MKLKRTLLGLLVGVLVLSCSMTSNLPFLGPTSTPTATQTPTLTPTPTATPTPLPTPTPVPAARIKDGDRALFNGDWDTALQEFESARNASQDPQIQAAALLGIGRTGLLSGDYNGAIQALESLIQNFPDSSHLPQAQFFLGQVYSALGRYTDAAQAYLNYLTLRPGIIDAYILDLRGDALFAAGDYPGAANDYQAALQSPSLADGIYIEMKIARAYSLAGDSASALGAYDSIYSRTKDDNTRALIDLRKGQIYTSLGQMDQAYAAYLDAVNNFPTSYDSYSALLELINAGVTVNELNRGLVDYFAGQYGVALAAFDRYLQNVPEDPGTARYYYGLTTRALGGYQGAIAEWDKVIQNYPDHRYWDEAWEQKAYTQWYYLDQYTLAVQTLLDFVAKAPNHPRAGEFLFDAAQVAERAGKLDQAAELWERVNVEYPAYEQAGRALFLAGICRYRMGDFSGAMAIFQRVLTGATNLGDRAAAFLWIGKSQKAQGDSAGARSTWEQAASVDPTGYYSERAIDLLKDRPAFAPPQAYDLTVDTAEERLKADAWLRTAFSLPEGTDISGLGSLADEPSLNRGTELWGLGLYDEARSEFETLRQSIQSDPVQSYRLAIYLADLGLYRTAILTARQVLDLAGMDDAGTMSAAIFFNHLRFGAYFSDMIIPIAQEYGFHPLFLYSVVRQESLFESFVSSSAGAYGLMQIIPSTGESIVKNLGWPPDYKTADLYRPVINLRLGADYLAAQRDAFDGDMYAALAAYNGGPGNALEWKKLSQDDPDLFLEVIRFSETRNYIRSIYEIFSIYRNLYDRSP